MFLTRRDMTLNNTANKTSKPRKAGVALFWHFFMRKGDGKFLTEHIDVGLVITDKLLIEVQFPFTSLQWYDQILAPPPI